MAQIRRDGTHSQLPLRAAIVGSLSLFFALAALSVSAYVPPASPRADSILDSGWKFIRQDVPNAQTVTLNDGAWTSIALPHTWNNLDGQDGGSNYYRNVGWYRRHFAMTADTAGRLFYLKFDGANQVADVYLNGTFVGEHKGGYSAFCFDVTSRLLVGADNILAIKVTNAANTGIAPLSADFTFFGGIYRDVHLLSTDRVAITPLDYASPGVYLKTTNVNASSASLQVTAKIRNAGAAAVTVTVTANVVDAAGNVIATIPATQTMAPGSQASLIGTASIATPHLWNGTAWPYLYKTYIEVSAGGLIRDVVEQPLGIRSASVDPAAGFSLNGTYFDLHGVNRHQDWLNQGWAISRPQHLVDLSLMTEMGCTAVRLSHYQHDDYFYTLCDSAGLVAWAEIPIVNGVTVSDSFYSNARQQLIELIRQNYNHPSICFWGIGNEIAGSPNPNPLLDTLNLLLHREDSSRFSTYASNTKNDTSTTNAINWHTDITGFNQYFGWYSDNGPLSAFAGWADRMHARYPTRCIGMSEYGGGGSIFQHRQNPPAPRTDSSWHPEEYQNLLHESYWKALKTRKFLWCKFIWCLHDFASDGRNEGDTPGRNDKGLVTYDRQTKKDAFYYYKANWTSAPVVYISSRRFTPRPVDTVEVKVYANQDSVQLFINDAYKSTLLADGSAVFKWSRQHLQQGSNVVKAIGFRGGVPIIDSCIWVFGTVQVVPSSPQRLSATVPGSGNIAAVMAGNTLAVSGPAAEPLLLRIVNPEGRVVLHERLADGSGRYRICLSSLPVGTYMLRINGGRSDFAKRITLYP